MSRPEILAVIQGSPIAERTAGIVSNILSQGSGLARVLVLTPGPWRGAMPEAWDGTAALAPREDQWADQILRAARESGCRWLVTPSYADRYLPGAFEAIRAAAEDGENILVGPCLVREPSGAKPAGPDPFTFDYFRLMFRQSYIAPGAAFISVARFLENRGFDSRFPTAAVLEYLIRSGPAGTVPATTRPLMETDACPFVGIPPEYASRYALEAALIAQEVNHIPFAPGIAAGVVAALCGAMAHPDYSVAFRDLRAAGDHWGAVARKLVREDLGIAGEVVTTRWQTLKGAIRQWTPRPVWKTLMRAKRAYQAFTAASE